MYDINVEQSVIADIHEYIRDNFTRDEIDSMSNQQIVDNYWVEYFVTCEMYKENTGFEIIY